MNSEIKIEAIAAVKQPSILNFGIKADTIMSINPLMNSKNNPKVRIVIGKVRNIKIGRITTLTTAKSKALTIEVKKSSTLYNFVTRPTT